MMGLLMLDTLLIDPALSESLRLLGNLHEWPYPSDAAGDSTDDESADVSAWIPLHAQPEPTTGRRWQRLIATEAR
jgi:hypothetical protein